MGGMGWDGNGMGMGRKGLGCIGFGRGRGAEVRGEMDEGRVEWMDGWRFGIEIEMEFGKMGVHGMA